MTPNLTPPDPARSRAVLIAVNEYLDEGLADYPEVAAGAVQLAKVLQNPEIWGISAENCIVLSGAASTDENSILDAVDEAAAEAEEAILVYFSGHGVTWEGQYHLAHSRARPGDCNRWLSWARLRSRLDDQFTRAKHRIVVLDACESADAIDRGGAPQGNAVLLASCSGTERAWIAPESKFPTYSGALIAVLEEGLVGAASQFTPQGVHEAVKARLTQGNQSPDFQTRGAGGTRPWLRNRAAFELQQGISEFHRSIEINWKTIGQEKFTQIVNALLRRQYVGDPDRKALPIEDLSSDHGKD
jgi:hypothetical protein